MGEPRLASRKNAAVDIAPPRAWQEYPWRLLLQGKLQAAQQGAIVGKSSNSAAGHERPGSGRRSRPLRRAACGFPGRFPQTFSNGLSNHRHSAGKKINAANMFTTNMNVSISPMSAWNFRSEKIHMATPTANVSAV